MSDTKLNIEDLRSQCWRKVKAHAEAELVGLRKNLEADQTPERTAKLRGQIRTWNLLLALEFPAPAIVEEEAE